MPLFFDRKKPKERSDRARLIIVEGPDDAQFFDKLLSDIAADPQQIGIVPTNGNGGLDAELKSLTKSRPFVEGKITKVGVVQDADASATATLAAVRAALVGAGLSAPGHGQFEETNGVAVGVFILPNGVDEGDLEKVCLDTVAETPKAARVATFFNGMDADFGPFEKKHKRRALVFLACVHEETRGVGNAFSQGVFEAGHLSLVDVKQFVSDMTA